MSVTQRIVSPQHNRPVVGLTQESMTNAYLMTKEGVIVNRAEAQQIIAATFPDLDAEQITQKIASLFKRLERTRSEKRTATGTPYHQHLIDNAVHVRLADLYQGPGVASDPSAASSSSCPPASAELQRYQRRAHGLLADDYWREQFATRSDGSESYEQWLLERFTAVDRKNGEALQLIQRIAADRITNERQRRKEMAELRRQYKESEDASEKTAILAQLRELRATSENDNQSDSERAAESYARRKYDEWFLAAAKINANAVRQTVEGIIRQEESERHYLTGRELFSLLYPEDYFYSKQNDADPREPVVRIEEGIHVEGQHTKATVGATHASIIGDLFKMYSPVHSEDFLSRAKWMTDNWASSRGMSLTLETCQTLDPSFSRLLQDKIKAAKIDAFRLGPRSNNPLEEARRQEVLAEIFRNVKNSTGKCALESVVKRDPANSLMVMATSGSKGSKENISSMMTMVGQQEFQGRPIPLLPGGRSVPSFERNSREPGARGFVERNYLEGMTPAEFFLHQYAAREGLFGTALKTAETGYMQRRILKAMEDAVVYPDNTVRNAQGIVIQYAYGEDGFSGDNLVMTRGRARFVDARRLLEIIQSRRKRGLPKLYKPPEEPATRELPRSGYVMPSFEGPRNRPTAAIEEVEEEEVVEKKEGEEEEESEEEEPDEGVDASDLSEGEMPDDE